MGEPERSGEGFTARRYKTLLNADSTMGQRVSVQASSRALTGLTEGTGYPNEESIPETQKLRLLRFCQMKCSGQGYKVRAQHRGCPRCERSSAHRAHREMQGHGDSSHGICRECPRVSMAASIDLEAKRGDEQRRTPIFAAEVVSRIPQDYSLRFGVLRRRVGNGHTLRGERTPESSGTFVPIHAPC